MPEAILRLTELDRLEGASGNSYVLKFSLLTLMPSDCRRSLLHNYQDLNALGVILNASCLGISEHVPPGCSFEDPGLSTFILEKLTQLLGVKEPL